MTTRIDSREDSNIQQGCQQQYQNLTARTLSNISSKDNTRNITDVNRRRETSNSKDVRNSRDYSTTAIASAGTSTAQYGCQQLVS
jgi:Tfp pilus assembly protein PilV